MNALDRLRIQTRDLVEYYVDEDGDQHRPLMQQLLKLGPHLRPSQGVVGKVQPGSRPPGNLTAHQLHSRIIDESTSWAWSLGGARIKPSRALALLPTLAQQRVDTGDKDKQKLLHGATGLYSNAAQWHLSVRIFLGYDKPADRYPSAICPECHYQDKHGGSIRVRETLAWCSNSDCRDEHGRRHEWSKLVLEDLIRAAIDAGKVFHAVRH